MMPTERTFFFDHINAAPPFPEAVKAVADCLLRGGNPQSDHRAGRAARTRLDVARAQIARFIGAHAQEVLFGASGTELGNLAIKGYLKANRRKGRHIVLSAVESPRIDRPCRRMEAEGYRLTRIGVDHQGAIDLDQLADAITPGTALVCVQLGNPEVGTVQRIADVAAIAHQHKAAMLVDACAAAGRVPVDVEALNADLLIVSSGTLGGPPGAAALYIRKRVRLQPEIDGGVQEHGLRGGLENVPACVGFAAAAHKLATTMPARTAHLNALAARFTGHLTDAEIHLTGPVAARLPGHVSLLVSGTDGQSLLARLDEAGVAASSGSFCGAQAMKASAVLTAMGYTPTEAGSGIVFSFGPENTAEEVDEGAKRLRECISQCKQSLKRQVVRLN